MELSPPEPARAVGLAGKLLEVAKRFTSSPEAKAVQFGRNEHGKTIPQVVASTLDAQTGTHFHVLRENDSINNRNVTRIVWFAEGQNQPSNLGDGGIMLTEQPNTETRMVARGFERLQVQSGLDFWQHIGPIMHSDRIDYPEPKDRVLTDVETQAVLDRLERSQLDVQSTQHEATLVSANNFAHTDEGVVAITAKYAGLTEAEADAVLHPWKLKNIPTTLRRVIRYLPVAMAASALKAGGATKDTDH